MMRDSILSRRCGGENVPFAVPIPVVLLCLLMVPTVTLCATWEPIGPSGGSFVFSISNPANADEITAITSSPSPSNVYRSTDGGASWNKVGEVPYPYVYDVSAFDYSTLYALSSSRCFRSADGGITWTEGRLPTSSGYAYAVCAHPTDSRTVYAVGYYADYREYPYSDTMVLFKSTDGGLSWSASQFFTYEHFYPYDMAISASNPDLMYVVGSREVNNVYGGAMLTSTDGGQTWADISNTLSTEPYSSYQCVAVDPTDDGRVYVGGDYVYCGFRQGREREIIWTRGQPRLYAYTICVDPANPSRIYVGGYEGIAVSSNYGVSWSVESGCVKSGAEHITVAPGDSSRVYVSTYAGFYKSPDRGSTWETAHAGIKAGSINAIAVDPSMILVQNSGYLMAFGGSRLQTWRDVVTPPSCGEVCDIQINPDNPDRVLILEGYG